MMDQSIKPVTILYVEDEATSRDITLSMLETILTETLLVSADNGRDGLQQFRTHRPEIVLTDICMPAMNGIEMAAKIKAEAPETIIIAITAYSETSFLLKAIEIGINNFVLKPLNFEKFIEIVNHAIATVRLNQKYKNQAEHINKLSQAVEQSPHAVVITDQAGRIEYVNPRFSSLTGYASEEIRETNIRNLQAEHTDQAVFSDFCNSIESGREWRGELCNHRKDGGAYWESTSISPVHDSQGCITHFVVVKEDITTRKRAEIEIAELNAALTKQSKELETANRDLEAFNYTVSHDLLTPVTVISGFTSVLLAKQQNLDDRGREYVETIQNEAKKMDGLIKTLLKFSLLSSQEISYKVVDLSMLASMVALEIGMQYPQRQVSCSIAPGLACVGESNLLRIVLWNLLGNAWKYTAPVQEARVEFGATDCDGESTYFVRDNGVGFDNSKADNLFKTFKRLHHADDFEGFGIGLATVQRIIDRHGGRTWAEGEVNKGACIYFTLPQQEQNSDGGQHGSEVENSSARS